MKDAKREYAQRVASEAARGIWQGTAIQCAAQGASANVILQRAAREMPACNIL